uniref:Uncharacterized protein n=1 Tax=Globodera rostochiensis TaxID=31243 RepID=A0A914HJK7_GLORO
MKMFALIMLRCTLIMLLCPLLQSGTLATLGKWEKSCQFYVSIVSFSPGFISLDPTYINDMIKKPLTDLLNDVKKFPLEGMDELLDRRLKKPLGLAIGNCKKILNELKQSGREDNKKYLESLVAKTSSIANGIGKEFNTFIFEVELELFTNDGAYFSKEYSLLSSGMGNNPRYEPGTPEFVDFVESLILNAKLKILETEFYSKIAGLAEQQPLNDGDGFLEFSKYFKVEWKLIEKMIGQLTSNNDKDTFRKRLDNLGEKAMEETAPLKAIITKKLDELCPGPLKNIFIKAFKSDQKKQKEAQINAKKVINDIGMFDGAAYKLLVRFEHVELDTDDFCAELEKAVAEDKQMVSKAYKVKDNEL